MAEIKIKLNPIRYKVPTEEDISAAKEFILRRESYADTLGDRIDDIIAEAAALVVAVCYKYNVSPKSLLFSSAFNKDMMDEISMVMDEAEAEILDLTYEYSTRVSNDRNIINPLIAWMALLGRGNKNLKDTLETYMYKMMKDWEAAIAAMRYLGTSQSDAITKIKTYIHHIYEMPEVRAAIRRKTEFAATYIRLGGVQPGAVGISNNGSTNVVNMGKITLQMAWMKAQLMDFKSKGAAGYYQLRGSTYACDICDDAVGLHIGDILNDPFPHSHCCCYRVPIYLQRRQDDNGVENTDTKQNSTKEYEKYLYDNDYEDVKYDPNNGGLRATHINHNFDKETGQSEKIAQQIGFGNGHRVILGPERHDLNNVKNIDGTWDGMKMEIATATTGSRNNLIHAISHCGSKPNAEIAVIHIPAGTKTRNIESAVRSFAGLETSNPKQWHKFKEILFVIEESGKIKAYHP